MKKRICILLAVLLLCTACGRQTKPETTAPDNVVTVTFPEGMTVLQAAEKLESSGVCTAAEFLEAVKQTDSPYASTLDPEKRPFLLEGYLFPDTYEFYKQSSGSAALSKFLENLEKKWTSEMQESAEKLGMTMDEVLTLASIIQSEAGYSEEMPHVSSVLHNRLRDGIMLQCDVTYFYLEKTVMPYLCGDKWDEETYNKYVDLYYTYRFSGLPEGPICNPGADAIHAALAPDDTKDYYFVTDADGKFYYAETHEEHLKNCKTIKGVK